MKKLLFITILSLSILLKPSVTLAQSIMMGGSGEATTDSHTAREEAEGKEIWEKLQTKQLECKNLTDDNFETLGEYFMGQMAGSSHEAMNNMMKQMMGENGEQQMHIVMGKRLSGCDTSTFMPMVNMMVGMMGSASAPRSFNGTKGGGNPMMGYGWNNMMGSFGLFGWLSIIIFWLLLILAVIALVKWLTTSGRTDSTKTPIEIVKERYAKGEIDKKEFEQKKKDLE